MIASALLWSMDWRGARMEEEGPVKRLGEIKNSLAVFRVHLNDGLSLIL